MIRNSLYSQDFTTDELIFMWEAVRWQRRAAEDESPSYNLEEYILFCRYLEDKLQNLLEGAKNGSNNSCGIGTVY